MPVFPVTKPLTSKPLELARPFGLGGSDIGPLLGLSPYKTPLQLWAEKVSLSTNATKDAIHLRFGHHVEPFIAQEYERQTGLRTISHAPTVFHPDHGFMFAHLDRLVLAEDENLAAEGQRIYAQTLLECKTASVFNRDEWGEPGSDQVPPSYLVQCVWYMAVTQCKRADLAVLLGNQDFRIFQINRDMELENLVLDHARQFWFDHVLSKVPPSPVTEEDIRTLYPKEVAGHVVEADHELLASLKSYKSTQAKISELTDQSDALRKDILNRMGEAEQITLNNKVLATWKASKPAQRLDTKAIAAAHPELAKQFMLQGTISRRFVVKELA
jgi:putative phage-type endonuclease